MKSLYSILSAVGLVAAHGYVDNATIGGQFYQVKPRSALERRYVLTSG